MTASKAFTINVDYRELEGYHVFTSEDVYGLYVASRDAETAFNRVAPSIMELVRANFGVEVSVEPAWSFREFAIMNDVKGAKSDTRPLTPDHPQQFVVRHAA